MWRLRPHCVVTVDGLWVFRYERHESPRTLAPFCIFLPHLRTRRCVILIWVSRYGFPRTLLKNQPYLNKCSEYHPWSLDAFGLSTVEELASVFETRFNAGFDFATILSSPYPCCIIFAIVFGQLAELKFWEQQTELKWLILHKWRRLFHSSRVKLPFVNMSGSCCWVSTNLIWNFGSKLILSNNQSCATLWSHCRTSACDDHLNHCFILFKDLEHRTKLRRLLVWWNMLDIG